MTRIEIRCYRFQCNRRPFAQVIQTQAKHRMLPQMEAPVLARSRGAVRVSLKASPSGAAFDRLYQSGCLRLRMPRTERRAQPEAVLINTSGGLTGGDKLDIEALWLPGARASLTTQAAEKIYRASYSKVSVRTRLQVQSGAEAEWLPQETIFFNGAALDRRLDVILASGSKFLGIETVVFGRRAMGEEVAAGSIRDAWRIYRNQQLIYVDAFHLAGQIAAELDRNSVAAGARAYAIILFVSDEIAPGILQLVRSVLPPSGLRSAASSWNGILAVRILSPNGELLRRSVADVLSVLRPGVSLPRVWRC